MTSTYGWIIDRDLLAEEGEPNAFATMGPRDISDAHRAQLINGKGTPFRIRDDDGETYYIGRFVGDAESEDAFGPLDDFGGPNAGATEIQYKNGNRWETL